MPRILPAADRLAHVAMNVRGFESRYVTTGGVRLHVYDGRGRGDLPTVVFIHGLGAAGVSFARVVARLLPHTRRVIVPELPGHGRSGELTASRLTPDILIDTMTTALETLLEEPAILCGNSLGGAVAFNFALRRPDRVRALVLVSPAGAPVPEEEFRELLDAFAVTDRRTARRLVERIYHRPPWFLALVAHEFPDVLKRRAVRDLLETATVEHAAKEEDLGTLRMPVLLLWGRSDRLLPAQALAFFRRNLPPHAVIEEPEGLGHSPQLEHPSRLAERILRFARDVVATKQDAPPPA